MGKYADALKKLIDKPEDLSELPQIIENVSKLEENEELGLEKIGKLQELNRKYLGMIPINDETEKKEEKEEVEIPTIAELAEEMSKGDED